MSWFDRIFGKKQLDSRLIGKWHSDPTDEAGRLAYGKAEMKFDADGKLTYTVLEQDGRAGIMNLTWSVDGKMIMTDQPSHPDPQSSQYELSNDGVLTISFGGEPSRFVRQT